ncbi:PREDICTED: leucine-rich repeat extensin-like protein 3 [Nelumbo nucifera]|uniref:Leucine-rich repeat extensin-like protein 3 n=1 Tax=Nelumbo nucifera TaxID=4432 RepID=A0A1U8Q3W5_NELNU|nr:PREDICTED: leucine-rich repeat extensin-like protein 3 [Nelumbo nucifera]
MSLVKFLLLVALWLSVSGGSCGETGEVSGDGTPSSNACFDCSTCPYPCHNLSPPPSPLPESGYPLYGTPPPPAEENCPPPPLPESGNSIHVTPPPPPAQDNCPPPPVAQCCQYPPPRPYQYLPYSNYSAPLPSNRFMNFIVSYIILFFVASLL